MSVHANTVALQVSVALHDEFHVNGGVRLVIFWKHFVQLIIKTVAVRCFDPPDVNVLNAVFFVFKLPKLLAFAVVQF